MDIFMYLTFLNLSDTLVKRCKSCKTIFKTVFKTHKN